MTKGGAIFNIFPILNFETHHGGDLGIIGDSKSIPKVLKSCYTNHAPYRDPHERTRSDTILKGRIIFSTQSQTMHYSTPYMHSRAWPSFGGLVFLKKIHVLIFLIPHSCFQTVTFKTPIFK